MLRSRRAATTTRQLGFSDLIIVFAPAVVLRRQYSADLLQWHFGILCRFNCLVIHQSLSFRGPVGVGQAERRCKTGVSRVYEMKSGGLLVTAAVNASVETFVLANLLIFHFFVCSCSYSESSLGCPGCSSYFDYLLVVCSCSYRESLFACLDLDERSAFYYSKLLLGCLFCGVHVVCVPKACSVYALHSNFTVRPENWYIKFQV